MHEAEAEHRDLDFDELRSRLLATATWFAFLFGVVTWRLVQLALFGGAHSTRDALGQLLIAVLVVAGAASIIYLLIRAPINLARVLLWVARGNHERRIGAVGLGFLCLGFLFQAWVNVIS